MKRLDEVAEVASRAERLPIKQRVGMRASAKLIQSLSAGIYRTPANALKELVSNAFDADANNVQIQMDYPKFGTIRILDDGDGIDPDTFAIAIQRIGGSIKRAQGNLTPKGRPIIGRIGIGLLAVGQACRSFKITSAQEGLEKGLAGEVSLAPFFEKGVEMTDLSELQIGNVTIREFDKAKSEHYTMIALEDVLPTFRRKLVPSARQRKGRHFEFSKSGDPDNYEQFVRWLSQTEVTRIDQLSGYNRFMWELGLITPVRYLKDGPVVEHESKVIPVLKRRLEAFNFRVFVDAVELFKPILLPNDPDVSRVGADYKAYDLKVSATVDGKRVSAIGYYYHQVKRIKPAELRGLLPRVHNVGIGDFDSGFFRLIRESPIISYQLSGELYVDLGLDQALNIDRNSFFENDDAYMHIANELQRQILLDEAEEVPFPAVTAKASRETPSQSSQIPEEEQAVAEITSPKEPILRDIKQRQKEHIERRRRAVSARPARELGRITSLFGYEDFRVRVVHGETAKRLIRVDKSNQEIEIHLPERLRGSSAVQVRTLRLLTLIGLCLREAKTVEELETKLIERLKAALRE